MICRDYATNWRAIPFANEHKPCWIGARLASKSLLVTYTILWLAYSIFDFMLRLQEVFWVNF